jgi:predicted type IV restriction endonuclease
MAEHEVTEAMVEAAEYCEKNGHDWDNVPEGRYCITCNKFQSGREIEEEDRPW